MTGLARFHLQECLSMVFSEAIIFKSLFPTCNAQYFRFPASHLLQ